MRYLLNFDIPTYITKAIISVVVTIGFGQFIKNVMANLIEDKEYIHRFLIFLVMFFRDTSIYSLLISIISFAFFYVVKVFEYSSIPTSIFVILYAIALFLILILWLFQITIINSNITDHFKIIEVNNTKYQLHSLKDNKALISYKDEIEQDYQNFSNPIHDIKDIKKYTLVNKRYLLLDKLDGVKEYRVTHHFAENNTEYINKIHPNFSQNMCGYYLTQMFATVIGLIAFFTILFTSNQSQIWSSIQYLSFMVLVYIWQYYQLKISRNVYRNLKISNYESLLKSFEQL